MHISHTLSTPQGVFLKTGETAEIQASVRDETLKTRSDLDLFVRHTTIKGRARCWLRGTVCDEEKEPRTSVMGCRWATCLQLSLQGPRGAPAAWFEKLAEGGPWQTELGHLHIPGELTQLRSTWRSGSGWEAGP